MKQLIHVSCTSAYKYPETPKYVMIRGRKYPVEEILETARIQSAKPPFCIIHYFKVRLETANQIAIEYHENTGEWYLVETGGEK